MPFCLRCGRHHETRRQICPDCQHEDELIPATSASSGDSLANESGPDDEFGDSRVAIARFQSGAEAGYFADELARQTGIETNVLTRERFDAVHAAWTVDYILLVSPDRADDAPRLLQELVDASGDDDVDAAQPAAETTDLPAGVWVPLIITLAAGSIACFGIERADHRPRPAGLVIGDGRKPPELWEILGATPGSWEQKRDDGGIRRLTLDREQRTALLTEDHDGDGQVDREWTFSWQAK